MRSLGSVVRSCYKAVQAAASATIDTAVGVRTTQRRQDVASPPIDLYARPFGWWQVARMFQRCRLEPDDVLVDFGSGTGRVVLFAAARFRCRRVIGVERDERLDAIARRNVSRARLRPRTPIVLVRTDAVEFEIPDDVSVAFFYNSFDGDPFDQLAANLEASVSRAPRRLRFLYANPRAAEVLVDHPRFVLVDQIRSPRRDPVSARSCSVNIYEVRRS